MTVMGYNIDPDGDEACIGVELDNTGVNACIYIDNAHHQEEMWLDEKELRAFIAHCRETLEQIHWNMATWLEARDAGITHLMRKDDDPHGKVLCGRIPTFCNITGDPRNAWSTSPIIDKPGSLHMCKVCLKIWQRETRACES